MRTTIKYRMWEAVRLLDRVVTRKELISIYCSITGKSYNRNYLTNALADSHGYGYLLKGCYRIKKIAYNMYAA